MHQGLFTLASNSKFRQLFILTLLICLVLIGFFGWNSEYYTSSQINLFLIINKILCATPDFWLNVTALGDVAVLLPILSLAILHNVRIWAALIGSVPLGMLFTHGNKLLFEIPRPAAIIDNSYFKITGGALKGCTSLPSGHSLTIFAAITVLLHILIIEKKAQHPGLWSILLMLIASVVAISRITVGAHWPLDVLAGAVLGGVSGFSGLYLTDRYTSWWRWMSNVKFTGLHIITLLLFLYILVARESFIAIYWLSAVVGMFVIANLAIGVFNNRLTPKFS